MQELMYKWEEWYSDVVPDYQWSELEYKGRKLLFVHGRVEIACGGDPIPSDLVQVMGYVDTGQCIDEKEHEEMAEYFKKRFGVANLSFWSD